MAPLDLHVLGTPPAFVLSQDQTLDKYGYISAFAVTYSLSELVSSNFRTFKVPLTFFVIVIPNFCHKKLIVFVNFSFTDKNSALFIFQCTIFLDCVLKTTKVSSDFFSKALSIFQCTILRCPHFVTAYLLYHICFGLSSFFSKLFQKSFSELFFRLTALNRRLIYFTTFFPFCQYFFSTFFVFVLFL